LTEDTGEEEKDETTTALENVLDNSNDNKFQFSTFEMSVEFKTEISVDSTVTENSSDVIGNGFIDYVKIGEGSLFEFMHVSKLICVAFGIYLFNLF
jgi:hypothetical protein